MCPGERDEGGGGKPTGGAQEPVIQGELAQIADKGSPRGDDSSPIPPGRPKKSQPWGRWRRTPHPRTALAITPKGLRRKSRVDASAPRTKASSRAFPPSDLFFAWDRGPSKSGPWSTAARLPGGRNSAESRVHTTTKVFETPRRRWRWGRGEDVGGIFRNLTTSLIIYSLFSKSMNLHVI